MDNQCDRCGKELPPAPEREIDEMIPAGGYHIIVVGGVNFIFPDEEVELDLDPADEIELCPKCEEDIELCPKCEEEFDLCAKCEEECEEEFEILWRNFYGK